MNADSSPTDEEPCVKSLHAVQAVNWRKRKGLQRSAWVWIDRHGREAESYRFDVIGVLMNGAEVRICHVENAFAVANSA